MPGSVVSCPHPQALLPLLPSPADSFEKTLRRFGLPPHVLLCLRTGFYPV